MQTGRAQLDHESDVLDRMAQIREELFGAGRAALGITGQAVRRPYLQELKANGVGIYPLVALGLLGIVDAFLGSALSALGPDIARTLGLSEGQFTSVRLVGAIVAALCPLGVAALVQRHARRALIAIIAGVGWSVITLAAGFVTSAVALTALVAVDALTTSAVDTVHGPLILDNYPPEVRVRTLSVYQGIALVGAVASPGLVALLTGPVDLTWRGTLVVLAIVCMAVSLLSVRLRDPGFGRFDTQRLVDQVRAATGREPAAPPAAGATTAGVVPLTSTEAFRRLLYIPTIRRFLAVQAVLGVLGVPLSTYFTFFLDQRWHLGPSARALFFATMPLFSIVAMLATARYGESLYRKSPGRLVQLLALFLFGSLVLVAATLIAPVFALVVVCYGGSSALLVAVAPASSLAIMAVIEPPLRPHAVALGGIASVGIGGIAGTLLLGSATQQLGQAGGMMLVLIPGAIACYLLWTASRTVEPDIDRLVRQIIDAEQVRELAAAGASLPLLSCRGIDFSYGRLQVLYGVDLAVAEAEMVALLGTNGSGKTTLLRVISGIGLPQAGTVRLSGADITYIDAPKRLRLGIAQVPGGQAVFGPLDVVENLRVYGHSHGRNRRVVEAGIEASFAAFPQLAHRRGARADTLSGGEQQMLALCKAFIVAPRLLCIDELSLGLAPKAVGELLAMVQQINAAGTAVVLVEQSVNLALSVAHRAYFMERGRVVFEGPSAALSTRHDLLRSVFLHGAARGLVGVDGMPP